MLGCRADSSKAVIQFPGRSSALEPIGHLKDRLEQGGDKGMRLLIDATKPGDTLWPDKYRREMLAVGAYLDDEMRVTVRENCGMK